MFIAFCFAIRIFDKNPMFRSERCSLGTRLKIGYGSSEKQNWPESNQTVQSATKENNDPITRWRRFFEKQKHIHGGNARMWILPCPYFGTPLGDSRKKIMFLNEPRDHNYVARFGSTMLHVDCVSFRDRRVCNLHRKRRITRENMMKATVPSDRSAMRRIPDAHGWLRRISRIRSCSATLGRGERAA